jgi:YegS/Rv2252/BmrU family lipid kinase
MPTKPVRVALIVNRHSRNGDAERVRAREALASAGIEVAFERPLDDPAAQLAGAVDDALRANVDALVAGGGDGTIASVGARLRHRGMPMGVLPLGTANSFARSLGIPTELDGAVATIAAGHTVDVDLGRAADRYFTNSAAIGLSGELAGSDIAQLKRRFGRVGYLFASLPRMLRHRSFRVRLVADGRTHEFRALEVVIANGRYHGGVLMTWQAHVDSHDLVARIVKGTSPWSLALAWLRSGVGRPAGPDLVELVRFTRAHVDVHPAQPVAVDGESIGTTPMEFAVDAAALPVFVPAHATT